MERYLNPLEKKKFILKGGRDHHFRQVRMLIPPHLEVVEDGRVKDRFVMNSFDVYVGNDLAVVARVSENGQVEGEVRLCDESGREIYSRIEEYFSG